jgi:hypothetical protein
VGEGEGGKVEGRYEEKTKKKRSPLYSFEVHTNCVFSSTFGKAPTFD